MSLKRFFYLFWILLLALPGVASHAQTTVLQAENVPARSASVGGLPITGAGASSLWNGYAFADSLPKVSFGGSLGVGIENGNSFDIGIAIKRKAISLSAWTSGLNVHLGDSLYSVSVLQRASVFQAQYTVGWWAFAGSVRVNYASYNKDLEATLILPTLAAEFMKSNYRFGARLSNFTINPTRLAGRVGQGQDSTVLQGNFAGNQKGPVSFDLYACRAFRFPGKISLEPVVQLGTGTQVSNTFIAAGSSDFGLKTQAGFELGYANWLTASFGYRAARTSKLSQVSWGLSLKLQQVTLFYSSYSFYYFTPYRAHQIGAAVAIR